MALSETQKVRQMLGEEIPDGGSVADTMFSDAEIVDFIDGNPDLERAALEGWRAKAAKLSSLVDTTEGNSQKKFSQLLDNAMDMIKMYTRSSSGATEGRTRIGRISRPGIEW